MDVYEVLFHIREISRGDAKRKHIPENSAYAELFKQVYEYIQEQLEAQNNGLVVVTNPMLITKVERDQDVGCWKVYLSLVQKRPEKECILWDLMHEYGHTKHAGMDRLAPKEIRYEHEKTVWSDAWAEISQLFPAIEPYWENYENWMNDCLATYK